MTISRGLAELKMLGKRIERALYDSVFVDHIATSKVGEAAATLFTESAKAAYQSIIALIERRERIKAAIVQSNAKSYVRIAGRTMTVAEAIDLKQSISYRQRLAAKLKEQQIKAEAGAKRHEDAALERVLAALRGSADGTDAATIEALVSSQAHSIVGLDHASQKADKLTEFVDVFLRDVDDALNVSNATTEIEIGDE